MSTATITNDGYNLLRNALSGADNPLISYVALGTSSTPPTVNDHTLGHEVLRKPATAYTNGSTGEILITMYLADGEGVGLNIAEVGFIGGNSASASANSGVLFAHGLYSLSGKTSSEGVQFQIDVVF